MEKIVDYSLSMNTLKEISNQLAMPLFAGYRVLLNKEEIDHIIKYVPTEKIEVLLDEYSTEVLNN